MAKFGLYPISSIGIPNSDTSEFEMYFANNIDVDPVSSKSYISTRKAVEKGADSSKNYIAFDLFLKNVTGSPVSDNLYIDSGTNIIVDSGGGEQVDALINSARIGFVKIGTVPQNSTISDIQNMKCNNNCEMVIYEPNATSHTELSIERAKKYGINLLNGQYFPTYSITGEMDFFELTEFISLQAPSENFELQITKIDTSTPIFELPDGITKIRVYVWLEGQDIDSVETKSEGADVSIAINLIKDTAGYDAFNE